MRLESEHFATFVPADPPRAGTLAVWGDGQGPDEFDLVLPAGGGTRRRRIRGRLLPLAAALPALLAPVAHGASASVAAWSAAAATGVGLVARGRLLPAASPDGYGAWRVGPLDAADLDWLRRIAVAMPPEGHALPVDARRPLRLRSPEWLVRELWDAIADSLVRTPAAVHATGARVFAAAEPVRVGELAGWLAETDQGLDAGAQVQLRIEPPAKEEEPFAAVVQARSVADPSLVVDAAELWSAPAAVLARLGERAETDLLLALRRGARAWSRWRRCCARRRRPRSASTRSRWPTCWRAAPRPSAVPASRSCGRPSCSARGWMCAPPRRPRHRPAPPSPCSGWKRCSASTGR